jgi:hypothetical protein
MFSLRVEPILICDIRQSDDLPLGSGKLVLPLNHLRVFVLQKTLLFRKNLILGLESVVVRPVRIDFVDFPDCLRMLLVNILAQAESQQAQNDLKQKPEIDFCNSRDVNLTLKLQRFRLFYLFITHYQLQLPRK